MQDLKPTNTVGADIDKELERLAANSGQAVAYYGTKREPLPILRVQTLDTLCFEYVSEHIRTQRIIVCAALRFPHLDLIIPGARHYSKDVNVMMNRLKALGLMPDKKEQAVGDNQGFLDNFGNYWTREQALIIAKAAGQLEGRDKSGCEDELFSEDLY